MCTCHSQSPTLALPTHPCLPPVTLSFLHLQVYVYSVSKFNAPFLESTYKWHHMIFVCLCLTHFTQYNSLSVHPMLLQMVLFICFLLLSNIPLYVCITSSLSIPLSMDILVANISCLFKYCCNELWGASVLLNYGFHQVFFSFSWGSQGKDTKVVCNDPYILGGPTWHGS